MANLPNSGGGGGETNLGDTGTTYAGIKPVEIVPINGGSSIKIGPTDFPGVTSASQSGGVNTPTKRTEQGYDYTTRVNREAREATIKGWVKAYGLQGLRKLRREKEPFAVAAGHVIIERASLEDLQEDAPEDAKGGAYEVTVKIREAFQAKAGTSNIEALTVSGKKTAGAGGGGSSGGGDTDLSQSYSYVQGTKSSGKATGNTEE